MRILVTRPEPEASALASQLRARGHSAVLAPMLRIAFVPLAPAVTDGVQALIATSRNGLRALDGDARLEQLRRLRIFVVGDGTAAAAQERGFTAINVGDGAAASLVGLINEQCRPAQGPLLHLAGERLAFDVKQPLEQLGFVVQQPVVYSAQAVEQLPEPARDHLAAHSLDAAILMSPQTAAIYVTLVQALGFQEHARHVRYLTLSAAVAERLAPLAPTHVTWPDYPSAEEMLDLVNREAAQFSLEHAQALSPWKSL
jgi:uroporphyrinogen-III synthase